MNPRRLLHLEGAAVLTVSLLSYHWSHGSWLQFALLFLLPDLSMLGYVANIRVGAITYNAVHTYVGPLVLAGYSFASNRPAIVDRDQGQPCLARIHQDEPQRICGH